MTHIRPAAVAGMFYPDQADLLRSQVGEFLNQAGQPANARAPKVLIAPHAGYVYSGAVAATAYIRLAAFKDTFKRVILLGPCHRVGVKGLALSSTDAFETPLGSVPVDRPFCKRLLDLPQVSTYDATHAQEHALEVHLPFLQEVLDDVSLVPLVVGQATPDEVGEVLDHCWGGPETLIVISTDLSHYLDYETCQKRDQETVRAIETLAFDKIMDDQACGRTALKGLLYLAQARTLEVETLAVQNSGDTGGGKDRVVGYGAFALYETRTAKHDAFSRMTRALLRRHGGSLLHLSAMALKRAVRTQQVLKLDLSSFPGELTRLGACFVTLEVNGNLRGCIGTLSAHQPLVQDIAENSFKAGFCDPRFPPVSEGELKDLSVHISILSEAFAMTIQDEADLLSQLRPKKDGLILEEGGKRALFLPSVWDKLPEKGSFISHLKQKAGLPADYWSKTIKAYRFVSEGVSSEQLDAPEKLWQDTHS